MSDDDIHLSRSGTSRFGKLTADDRVARMEAERGLH